MMRVPESGGPAGGPCVDVASMPREALAQRYDIEMRLCAVVSAGGGLAPLVRAVSTLTGKAAFVLDHRERVVARGLPENLPEPAIPKLSRLLEAVGPYDLERPEPVMVAALRKRGLTRRHLITPIVRHEHHFAWLVVAEFPTPFSGSDAYVAQRVSWHLATEYATQRRVARVAWNARAGLARQLIRGTSDDGDLRASAEYLGVDLDIGRVIVFLTEQSSATASAADIGHLAELVADRLGAEVLPIRGTEGTTLAVAAPEQAKPVSFVGSVKHAVLAGLEDLGDVSSVAGVSAIAGADQLRRAYREAREVTHCINRFGASGTRVVAADDLGPARLFIANSDVKALRTYVEDMVGALLTGAPGTADLLWTLQCFFDTGRSVRESARALGIHENTVRLRLAKVHDLTGLDVAAVSNDQLSAQTALLVLRLQGHPSMGALAHRASDRYGESA